MAKNLIFGYATLGDQEYIEALLGEVPTHFLANLQGYELCIQRFRAMPEIVQNVVRANWKPEEFSSYFVRKSANPENQIKGIAWLVSDEQEAVLDDWEFERLWYSKDSVEITDDKGEKHSALVYVINEGAGEIVSEPYKSFPVNKEKMLRLARDNNLKVRK